MDEQTQMVGEAMKMCPLLRETIILFKVHLYLACFLMPYPPSIFPSRPLAFPSLMLYIGVAVSEKHSAELSMALQFSSFAHPCSPRARRGAQTNHEPLSAV